jgi:Major capsid protein N-terminus/Large eukaryotic DNA virus major capsid protein
MSQGAILQVAAVGLGNIYTTIAPGKTFFVQLYVRHTMFAINIAEIGNCGGNQSFGCKPYWRVNRAGDMLGETYIWAKLSPLGILAGSVDPNGNPITATSSVLTFTNAVGFALIEHIEMQGGTQKLDRLHWFQLDQWDEVCTVEGKKLDEEIGKYRDINQLRDAAAREQHLMIPLCFSNSKDPSVYVALIAMQYHDLTFCASFRCREHLIRGVVPDGQSSAPVGTDPQGVDYVIPFSQITGGNLCDVRLMGNYVYLDRLERQLMASTPREILFQQDQYYSPEFIGISKTFVRSDQNFNHPGTAMNVFAIKSYNLQPYQQLTTGAIVGSNYFEYGIDDPLGNFPWQAIGPIRQVDPYQHFEYFVNGNTRIYPTHASYFRLLTNYERALTKPQFRKFTYSYYYTLNAASTIPEGEFNVSRIDCQYWNAKMQEGTGGGSAVNVDMEQRLWWMVFNAMKYNGGMIAVKLAG